MASTTQRTRWEILAVLTVVALALFLRLERIETRSLWVDEGFSLDAARQSLPKMLEMIQNDDNHPIGYYLALSAWIRLFGEDLARMRLLSVLCGLAAILLTWRLGRRLFSPAVGVVAAALLAVNPFQVFAANELRMYLPLEALALASTWVLWRAVETRRTPWWIAYGAALALMAHVSYYGLLLIPAQVLWMLLVLGPAGVLRAVSAALLPAVVLYAPWTPHLAVQLSRLRDTPLLWRPESLWLTYVPEVFASQTFGGYLFNMLTYHSMQGLEAKYFGIFLLPFVLLAIAGAAALGRLNAPARALVGLSWAVPVILVVGASLAGRRLAAYPYHLNYLQPFLALCLAAGIVHLRDVMARVPGVVVSLTAALSVLVFVGPAVDNMQGHPDYQYYQYSAAARLVRNLYQPTDVVIYLPHGVSRAFQFYFAPPGLEMAVRVGSGRWDLEALQDSIRRVSEALTPDHERIWLVYGPPLPERAVEDLVIALERRGYRRAIVNDYRGLRVGLLVLPKR